MKSWKKVSGLFVISISAALLGVTASAQEGMAAEATENMSVEPADATEAADAAIAEDENTDDVTINEPDRDRDRDRGGRYCYYRCQEEYQECLYGYDRDWNHDRGWDRDRDRDRDGDRDDWRRNRRCWRRYQRCMSYCIYPGYPEYPGPYGR